MKASTTLFTVAVLLALALTHAGNVSASIMYFDTNGATAGSTNSTTQQTWNTGTADWTTDSTGSIATGTYVDGSDAVFSAGTNAVSTYNVSTAGNKIANSVTVEEGTITFLPSTTPPTRTIGGGGITLASTANGNMTWSNANGGNTLLLSASQAWTDNHATAAIVVACPVKSTAATGTTTLTTSENGTGDVLISGAITDGTSGSNLALSNNGPGRLNIQGADTYTGGTSVAAGIFLLDNGGSLAHANISVTGGTFAGGTTGAGGSITDNIANDIAELVSLSGSGTLDLTNLNFTLSATGTQTQAEYVLANADIGSSNVTGTTFASVSLPAGWTIAYTGTVANPGDIVLVAPVPEPASLLIAALGALGLATGWARRRQTAA